jgi:hypothetical protein
MRGEPVKSTSVADTERSTPQAVRSGERVALRLPPTYFLDCSDPDILGLRRQEGSFVAACSARSAAKRVITQAAEGYFRKEVA